MRRRRTTPLVAAVVLAALLLPAIPASAVADSSASDYARRVGEAERAVAAAGAIGDEAEAAAVSETVLGLLPPGEVVEAGGGPLAIDNSVARKLATDLGTAPTPAQRERAAALLGDHLRSLALAVSPAESAEYDAGLMQRVIDEERMREESALSRWIREAQQALSDWLASWLEPADPNAASARFFNYLSWALAALALAVVAFSAFRWWRAAISRRDAGGREAATGSGGAPVVAAAAGLPADVLTYADERAEAGDYREAVRALFGGAARVLGERGIVERTRTRTTYELLADVRARAASLDAEMTRLAEVFEPAWYGHHDPAAEGFQRCREAYVGFRARIEAGETT